MEKTTLETTNKNLVQQLRQLGLFFILSDDVKNNPALFYPDQLIKLLAQNNEARLRLALIPLFLEHPEYSNYVLQVLLDLKSDAQLTLKFYYTAAMFFLQKFSKNNNQLSPIPDFFSRDLGLQLKTEPDENLKSLSNQHKQMSKKNINWLGTYYHAAEIWQKSQTLKHLKNYG